MDLPMERGQGVWIARKLSDSWAGATVKAVFSLGVRRIAGRCAARVLPQSYSANCSHLVLLPTVSIFSVSECYIDKVCSTKLTVVPFTCDIAVRQMRYKLLQCVLQ